MDTESVVDPNANIIKPWEADKSVGDIIFVLSSAVGKRVDNADKST